MPGMRYSHSGECCVAASGEYICTGVWMAIAELLSLLTGASSSSILLG